MHPQLPRDVWLYMGQFIPDNHLRDMITLNSAFFHLGMNVRYRTVFLSFLGEREMKWLIRLMDPAIANRVRAFCANRIVIPIRDSGSGVSFDQDKVCHQALLDAVSCWPNLRELSVKCGEKRVESFLRDGWSSFGPSLQKLSLAGTIDDIRAHLPTTLRLPSLRELHIKFDKDFYTLSEHDTVDLAALADTINSASPTLDSLSINSMEPSADFSQLFLNLGRFPRLQHFSLLAIFHKAFSTTPDGLTQFLLHQSQSLRSVTLVLNTFVSSEESLSQWMISALPDPLILANLEVLEFFPTQLNTGFQAFLTLLQRSADTLTELTVRDRYLTYGEIESIVSTFSPHTRLHVLNINVRAVSLRLFDLLARELPFLEKLSLHTCNYLRNGNTEDHEEGNMDVIRNGLRTRTYPNWKLRYLVIRINGVKLDRDIMEMLARSIPSLSGFWNTCQNTMTY